MFLWEIFRFALVFIFAVSSNTIFGASLPEFYGVYIKDNGKYHEGKPASKGASGDFSGKTQILIFDKTVMYGGKYTLYKIMFGRNKIIERIRGQGKVEVSAYNNWHFTAGHPVDTRIKPVKGEPEMIYIVPRKSLPPGFYAVSLGNQNWIASFYVDKERLPNNLSNSDLCVDILVSIGKEVPCNQSKAGSPIKSGKNVSASTSIDRKLEKLIGVRIASERAYRKFIKDEEKRSRNVVSKTELTLGNMKFSSSSKTGGSSWLRSKAHKAYQLKDYQKTIDIYTKIMNKDPKDWWGHAILGDCYIETRKIDKGLEHIATAIRIFPANFLFVIVYKAYAIKGDIPTAQRWLAKALDSGYAPSAKDARELLKISNNNERVRKLLEKHR